MERVVEEEPSQPWMGTSGVPAYNFITSASEFHSMNELSNGQKQKHEAITKECPLQKFTFSLLKHKGLRFQRWLQVIFLQFFFKVHNAQTRRK